MILCLRTLKINWKKDGHCMTEREFADFLNQIAGRLRDTDWGPSTDDLSESLYGMSEYLDQTDSETPRGGLTWDMIASMILAGMQKTKAYNHAHATANKVLRT